FEVVAALGLALAEEVDALVLLHEVAHGGVRMKGGRRTFLLPPSFSFLVPKLLFGNGPPAKLRFVPSPREGRNGVSEEAFPNRSLGTRGPEDAGVRQKVGRRAFLLASSFFFILSSAWRPPAA